LCHPTPFVFVCFHFRFFGSLFGQARNFSTGAIGLKPVRLCPSAASGLWLAGTHTQCSYRLRPGRGEALDQASVATAMRVPAPEYVFVACVRGGAVCLSGCTLRPGSLISSPMSTYSGPKSGPLSGEWSSPFASGPCFPLLRTRQMHAMRSCTRDPCMPAQAKKSKRGASVTHRACAHASVR
jgi:hypothetical protein